MEDNSVQPGQTIGPSSSPAPAPAPAPAPPDPTPPPQTPAPEQPAPDTSKKFDAELPDNPAKTADSDPSAISWTASEFIAHAKSFRWYATLAIVALVAAVLIYLLTRDAISSGVIIIAAIFLGIYARHEPRELEYRLTTSGLSIGQKHFGYHQFRSFSVLPEGAFSSIVFMPLKRFAVTTTIYYAPEDEDKIVSLLSNYLPLEERRHDATDRLMHRIHF